MLQQKGGLVHGDFWGYEMSRLVKSDRRRAGLPPGSLVHIGEKKAEAAKITILDYDEAHVQEKEVKTVGECFVFREQPTVTWINVDRIDHIGRLKSSESVTGYIPWFSKISSTRISVRR